MTVEVDYPSCEWIRANADIVARGHATVTTILYRIGVAMKGLALTVSPVVRKPATVLFARSAQKTMHRIAIVHAKQSYMGITGNAIAVGSVARKGKRNIDIAESAEHQFTKKTDVLCCFSRNAGIATKSGETS